MNRTATLSDKRVLILDAEFPSALTILRSLSRQGIHCDIASAQNKPISEFSRFAKQVFIYPDPLTDTHAFIDAICRLLQEYHYDLIIPVTERTLIPLSASPQLDPWRDSLAIADKKALALVLDKAKTLQLAVQCGVHTPFSHTVASFSDIERLASSLDYPVVIKPGQSIPNADIRRQLSVAYAHSAEQLRQLSEPLLASCQLLIQEYAQGIGTGVEILANHGEIVYAFQHERLHELPLTGGGSCLRKSIAVNAVLLEASRKLIKALNWHGVAMVEFKWLPDTDKYWLMEINGRFWGSLPLAYAAGADFPKMLFDLWVLKKLPAAQDYKKEVYCRKLTADLHWLEQVLRRSDRSDLIQYPSKKSIMKDCLLALHPTRHFFDIQCWSDPAPGMVDGFSFIHAQSLRVFELLRYKALLRWHSSSFIRHRLQKRIKIAKQVLFLCYGNINRSALAQVLVEHTVSSDTQFYSAGFHHPDKRPADSNMVEVAANNGIDLTNWQSTTLNAEWVAKSDLILAMEIAHLDRLITEYPQAKNKAFLLGTLIANSNDVEIRDPYNQKSEVYKQVFKQIESAVRQII
ncbi:MAG: ATP-grasp domain-containing protein [Methylococcaceae bacterium]|nr:ATP-grasp domain-containing protein [Methylococcaceae bacterium]